MYDIGIVTNKTGRKCTTLNEILAHLGYICNAADISEQFVNKVNLLLQDNKIQEAKQVIKKWSEEQRVVMTKEQLIKSNEVDGTCKTQRGAIASRELYHSWITNIANEEHPEDQIVTAVFMYAENEDNRDSEQQLIIASKYVYHWQLLERRNSCHFKWIDSLTDNQIKLWLKERGPNSNTVKVLANIAGRKPEDMFNNNPEIMKEQYIINNIKTKGWRSKDPKDTPKHILVPLNYIDKTVKSYNTRNKQLEVDAGMIFSRIMGHNYLLNLNRYDLSRESAVSFIKTSNFISFDSFFEPENITQITLKAYRVISPDATKKDIIEDLNMSLQWRYSGSANNKQMISENTMEMGECIGFNIKDCLIAYSAFTRNNWCRQSALNTSSVMDTFKKEVCAFITDKKRSETLAFIMEQSWDQQQTTTRVYKGEHHGGGHSRYGNAHIDDNNQPNDQMIRKKSEKIQAGRKSNNRVFGDGFSRGYIDKTKSNTNNTQFGNFVDTIYKI